MTIRQPVRLFCAAAISSLVFAGVASAQQNRALSPAAMLMAKELIDLKGATSVFDPIVNGVVEYHKNLFIQSNPNLAGEIQDVAQKLTAELQSRKVEMHQQLARIYAQHFTDKELRDALAFYRSPLGKKLIAEEPKVLEDAMKNADDWSRKLAEEVITKMRAEMTRRGHNLI